MSTWDFKPFHKEISARAVQLLAKYTIVYLAMEERTNKSSVILHAAESEYLGYDNVLIVTTKRAIPGWQEHLTNLPLHLEYDLTNYEQVKNLPPKIYDLVIVDEAHNFSTYPRRSQRWRALKTRIGSADVAYLSATPSAQTYAQLYHQFGLSKYSPWRQYATFIKWFSDYGIPETIYVAGRTITKRNKTLEDKVLADIEHLFIKYTRKQLGFAEEPKDILVYITPPKAFAKAYNILLKKRQIEINNIAIVCKTVSDLRAKLHQMEGGTIKLEDGPIILGNKFKAEWIYNKYGDTEDIVIMYYYQAEKTLLESIFKRAHILQSTAYAEGVNLSHIKHLIVYSMDFKTSKYIQRRARQCSLDRTEPIGIEYILIKNAISDQVYKTVAVNKKNYTDRYYESTEI